jgi:cell division protein FtsQ
MSSGRARVKVKSAAVTRAQAVADFSRKKAKQRRQQWKRRSLMIAGIGMLSYVAVGGWWMMHTGKLQASIDRTGDGFWKQTASVGFRIDQITLQGRKHTDAKTVKAALGVTKGDPILAVSLADMKQRLQAIPEVDSVRITRVLPDQLAISITERTPAAWWQKNGVQRLIDAKGVTLAREKYPEKLTLPVVVGDDVPEHVAELMQLLAAAPSLKPDVIAAVRVGQRRWNVQLAHDVVVLLPEKDPAQAWKRFASLVEKEALLSKAIRSVDMRMDDRVFILPIEQNQSPITLTNARDT